MCEVCAIRDQQVQEMIHFGDTCPTFIYLKLDPEKKDVKIIDATISL